MKVELTPQNPTPIKRKGIDISVADTDGKDGSPPRLICPTPLDALITVTMRLGGYEIKYGIESKEFFERYTAGETSDDAEIMEWASDYRHFLFLRDVVSELMQDVA